MPETVTARMILALWGSPEHTAAWASSWLRTLQQIRQLPEHDR